MKPVIRKAAGGGSAEEEEFMKLYLPLGLFLRAPWHNMENNCTETPC